MKKKLRLHLKTYYGEVKNKLPHGKGVLTFDDGSIIKGTWIEGILNGKGEETYGKVKNSYHWYLQRKPLHFIGRYKDGLAKGKGILRFDDGSKYDGSWVDGVPEGKGIETYSNGEKYIGMFSNGLPDSPGKHILANGKEKKKIKDFKTKTRKIDLPKRKKSKLPQSEKSFYKILSSKSKKGPGNVQGLKIWNMFSDKTYYFGETLNGIPHGKGFAETYETSDVIKKVYKMISKKWRKNYSKYFSKNMEYHDLVNKYIGEWKNGNLHGLCEIIEYYEPHFFVNKDGTPKIMEREIGIYKNGKKEGVFKHINPGAGGAAYIAFYYEYKNDKICKDKKGKIKYIKNQKLIPDILKNIK